MEPPGPAFGRPDDKLRVIRERPFNSEKPTLQYTSLHAGYKQGPYSGVLLRIAAASVPSSR